MKCAQLFMLRACFVVKGQAWILQPSISHAFTSHFKSYSDTAGDLQEAIFQTPGTEAAV